MLDLVDKLIERVLDTGWPTTPPPLKPGFFFTVPDEAWRTRVRAGVGMRLNIYLYEFRENRSFRRASWDQAELPDHSYVMSPPPTYLDCHYLISAWSPADDSELATPVLDEHLVLAEATRVLLRNPEVIPAAIGLPGGGPVFQQAHINLSVAPPEPPRVLNDFWSTMRLPWRPATMLVVTAPLDLLQDSPPAQAVTTFVQRLGFIDGSISEEWIDFGGFVVRASDNSPIAGATVTRLPQNQSVTTDSQGRYLFTRLTRGMQRFRASAPSFRAVERDIDIPGDPGSTHTFALSP
jgi:uncharacterized protein DUF4255/carboxypeptidase family protein